jgi:hypothetical protein
MAIDDTVFCWGREENLGNDAEKVFDMHVKVIFNAILEESEIEERYKDVFEKFNLEKLLFRMMWNKNENVRKLINPNKLLKFKNSAVAKVLSELMTSKHTVPDLTELFEISKAYVRKSFEEEQNKKEEETKSEEVKKDKYIQFK